MTDIRHRRSAAGVLFAGLVAASLFAAGCGPSRHAADRPDPLKGRFIGDIALKSVDGRDVRLKDVIGGKVALVDYWATWCAPCLAAMPHLDELNKRYKDRGFTVLGVMIDANAARVGPDFIRKKNLSYPNYLDDDAAQSEKTIGPVPAIPMLLLVDREGKVIEVFGGYNDESEVDKAVERVMGQAAPAA